MSRQVNNIIDTVERVTDRFNSNLSNTEKRLLDEVLNLTKEIKVKDGRIVSSVENLRLLSRIKTKLNKVVLNKEYMGSVRELVRGMDGILNSQTAYFKSLAGKDFKGVKDVNKKFELVQKMSIDSVVSGLTRTGIESNITDKINSILLRSITSGGMYADLVQEMSDFLTTTETKQGALTRYAQTWVNTSLNQYAGQNNKLMTDGLGLEWYMYVGGNKDTTREFCEHLKKKKYVHVSELPDIIKGKIDGHQCEIYERTGLPKGMIEGTTVENFEVNNGGWNCGHKLTPIAREAVPKAILDKFEYPQKAGIIGKKEVEPTAIKSAMFFDPLQVNSFLKLVDAFRQNAAPKVKKKAFENMLKNEKHIKIGGVLVMDGAKPNKTELHSASKLDKGGYYVVFPGDGQIKGIKKAENSSSTRKNDVYIYDKKTYAQTKVDIKTVNSGSRETISNHIIIGSRQANVIALDIQGGTTRWNLIRGLRDGWSKDTKKILLNWKGQWYDIDKKRLFSDEWTGKNIK